MYILCRFIRNDIKKLPTALNDQSSIVSERGIGAGYVMFCCHTSPLVIVHNKGGGI